MSISDIRQGETLLRMQVRSLLDEYVNLSDKERTILSQIGNIVRMLEYHRETLRNSYEELERPDNPTPRFFLFNNEGDCEEVSRQHYEEVTGDVDN